MVGVLLGARPATFSHSTVIVGSFSALRWCFSSTVLFGLELLHSATPAVRLA